VRRESLIWVALFIGITLLLLPNFYRNHWGAVETGYYTEWQTRYDRYVVARLVKTRQDGFFSAGGLLGLGDTPKWDFDSAIHRAQYNAFLRNKPFQTYIVYESNPGLQGILYGFLDKGLPVSSDLKLKIFRGLTALTTALVFSLILVTFTFEFGFLSGLLALLFTAVSIWIVLPAGSIFWNYWGFYLPFLASAWLLAEATRKNEYRDFKIFSILFLAALLKTFVSGFDLTTTVLVMATVPYIYHAIKESWNCKIFLWRFFKASIALVAGTLTGIGILLIQIAVNVGGGLTTAYQYILNRFTSHMNGDYEYFYNTGPVKPIGIMDVLPKYLLMPAINVQIQTTTYQVLYWHLIVVFALFTLIFILMHLKNGHLEFSRKSLAILVTTWYSLLAPLSWYVIFRPHSFIHTHVNTMAWQMPFTLFGFALCGYVITELVLRFRKEKARSVSHAL